MGRAEETVRVVLVGHVDHGKSSLVGRLLHETGSLPDGKVEAVAAMSRRRGMPFEWAFVTDALQAERDQGITIDASHIKLRGNRRDYVLIDAPGHREFLRNMITGAATGDAALLIIDAQEGIQEQSRRHGYLLDFVGIRQVVVAVNKMDLIGYDQGRFAGIEAEFSAYLAGFGVTAARFVPVSAREGDNVTARSAATPWYAGPTLADALDGFEVRQAPSALPLRLSVQDVYKFDERRIFAGTLSSGRIRVGDELLFSPSNKTAVVKSLEAWGGPAPVEAGAGCAVGVMFDRPLFIERGELISHREAPPVETTVFRARLFWLSPARIEAGQTWRMQHLHAARTVTVQSIERIFDPSRPEQPVATGAPMQDCIVDVVLRCREMLALDPYSANEATGRFVLVGEGVAVAGGLISMEGYPDQRRVVTARGSNLHAVEHRVTAAMRAERNGHRGAVLWLTGLSGAGKSTLGLELERLLFRKGVQAYVLDGDNVRGTLNADLGFSPEDRAENVRRIGAAAALFADAGMVVIAAVISPYRADRDRARTMAGDRFHEVWVKADLAVCEQRDPKGLYKRARAGEIADFTGISAPYEAPEAPDLVIDTGAMPIEEAVDQLYGYVQRIIVR